MMVCGWFHAHSDRGYKLMTGGSRSTLTRTGIVLAGAALLLIVAMSSEASADEFTFDGRGWGHGVGMSQYGARAMAEHGRSTGQILSHYYQGTSTANSPWNDSSTSNHIWVGLFQNRTDLRVQVNAGSATARHGSSDVGTIRAGETWRFQNVTSGRCQWRSPSGLVGSPGACNADVRWSNQPDRRIILPDKGNRQYARGHLYMRTVPTDTSRFHVAIALPVEHYTYGIAEMPSSWHMEALKAQAIAARSYVVRRALNVGSASNFNTARRNSCWCHVFDSVNDQVYNGWSQESVARWRSAVDATSRRVVTHNGSVIQAFYSSSSGGRTENNEDVWSGSALPYLRSVSDSWSLDSRAANPNASWKHDISGKTIASRVGLDSVSRVEVTSRNTSGSAREVRFHGRKGSSSTSVTRASTWVRSNLGLRSTYILRIFLPPFWDDDGNTHEQNIVRIYEAGITRGCNPPTNDKYCPTDSVTREQMAAFMVRALGLTRTSGIRFRDVPQGSTFERDIDRLATAGITRGCNPPANDRFCPKDAVSRDQMAAFLSRSLGLTNEGTKRFRDVPRGSTFERDINRIAHAGITHGCNPPTNDRYCPGTPVTRAEMASFLARAFLN
jgi:SpoIID/LytB domain protein